MARSFGFDRRESGFCDLFIYPGFRFRILDGMLTNFHLPKSSLLLLVCAFAGKDFTLSAYRHAVQAGNRPPPPPRWALPPPPASITAEAGVQYTPATRHSQKLGIGAQYNPDPGKILNAAYRDMYGNNLRLERVRLYETPNNWADRVRPD